MYVGDGIMGIWDIGVPRSASNQRCIRLRFGGTTRLGRRSQGLTLTRRRLEGVRGLGGLSGTEHEVYDADERLVQRRDGTYLGGSGGS